MTKELLEAGNRLEYRIKKYKCILSEADNGQLKDIMSAFQNDIWNNNVTLNDESIINKTMTDIRAILLSSVKQGLEICEKQLAEL